jgi:segregation and condensation protein B
MQIEQLKPIVEAALLAASQPMNISQLGDLFAETDEVGHEQIARALEALADDCEGRGVELKEIASGFRYQVRQEVHPWISRMWTEKPSRYSRALLETLALIAYRQPITRPEIEQIRGVVVSSNIVKTLEEREWIRVVGYRDVPGKPALFGTTRAFLDYFNLKSLDQLPPLSEIRDMEDPQMGFDQTPLPARVIKDLPIDPDEEIGEEAPAGDAAAEIAEAAPATDTHEVPQHEADAAAADTGAAASAADDDEASAHNEPEPATAGEAAAPADVEDDTAAQNS